MAALILRKRYESGEDWVEVYDFCAPELDSNAAASDSVAGTISNSSAVTTIDGSLHDWSSQLNDLSFKAIFIIS